MEGCFQHFEQVLAAEEAKTRAAIERLRHDVLDGVEALRRDTGATSQIEETSLRGSLASFERRLVRWMIVLSVIQGAITAIVHAWL